MRGRRAICCYGLRWRPPFSKSHRPDHLPWHEIMTNAEVFKRALGLSAPELVGGDLDHAEAVGLFSHGSHLISPCDPGRSCSSERPKPICAAPASAKPSSRSAQKNRYEPLHLQTTPTAMPNTLSTRRSIGCCQAVSGFMAATTMTTVVVIPVVTMSARRRRTAIMSAPM